MKYSFDTLHAALTATRVGNVSFHDFEPRIALVLVQIGAPPDNKIVEDANATALGDQNDQRDGFQ